MKRLLPLLLLTLAACTAVTPFEPQPITELQTPRHVPRCTGPNHQTLASIVRVATVDGSNASGVVIARNLVLTVAHALDDAPSALVQIDEAYYEARVLAADHYADLALLSVNTHSLTPVPLLATKLSASERLWAVGFPLALAQQTTWGQVKRLVDDTLYTSVPVDSGTSGGGLMRCESGVFELAGVVRGFGAYRHGNSYVNTRNLSTAVPAAKIRKFVESAGILL